MVIIFLSQLIFLIVCRTQTDTYTSSFDQTGFAQTIEIKNNDCSEDQDQYGVYFWHRFSFTYPKYTDQIKSFDLFRLTFNEQFQDNATYEDRVIYVESEGIAFNICSHDVVQKIQNVCKRIDISSYRYDMEWIFMFIQYRKIGQIQIYINFLSQKQEIFETMTDLTNVKATNYIGLFVGGAKYKQFAMNGQFFNAQLILGHQSQSKSFNDIVSIMNEKPMNDYIRQQHIYIQTDNKAFTGIYTKFVFYATLTSLDNTLNNNIDILNIDGSDGNTGKISSTLMKITLINNKLTFFSDNYATLNINSDDELKKQLFECTIAESYQIFYYFSVNMEDNTINIYCNQQGNAQISLQFNNRLFIPSKLIFTFPNSFQGMYTERSFLGGDYSTEPTDYMKMKTLSDNNLFSSDQNQQLLSFKSFSVCFWFRLFISFPDEKLTGNTIFSDTTAIQPLISVNLIDQPILDYNGKQNQYLIYGFIQNTFVKFYSNNLAQSVINQIYSPTADRVNSQWQWISNCITYKEGVNPGDSYIKSYQNIGGKYQEYYFTTTIDSSLNSNIYLQLNFQNSIINRQYYNVQVNIKQDYSAFLEEFQDFYNYINDIPIRQFVDKMLVNLLIPNEQQITSSLEFYGEGFNFALEYSITCWIKLVSFTSQTVFRMELSSTFQTYATFFNLSLNNLNSFILNTSVCIAQITTTPIPLAGLNQYIFIYAGYSKQLGQITLGIVYNDGTNNMVRTNYMVNNCNSNIPLSKYHLVVDNSWKISNLRLNVGQYSYETVIFSSVLIQGKWECSYKTMICTQAQTAKSLYSSICSSNYSLNSSSGECVVECPCSQYSKLIGSNKICSACNIQSCGYCISEGVGQCTYCVQDFSLNQNVPTTQIPTGVCMCAKSGYMLYNSLCSKCYTRCLECAVALNKCTQCRNGTQLYNSQCIPLDGYYYDQNDVIQPCDQSCKTCETTAIYCTGCDLTKMRMLNTSTHTCECNGRFTESMNTTTNISVCVVCDIDNGYYKASNYLCQKCDANCLLCQTSQTFCTSCDFTTQKRVLNQTTNTCDCQKGYYSITTSSECLICQNTCKECSSADMCTLCALDRILVKESATVQKCVCDKTQHFFSNLQQICQTSNLTASFSDYYSTTQTDKIYFSILFSKPVQSYLTDLNAFIKDVQIAYIPNPTGTKPLQYQNIDNLKYATKMAWKSSQEISVEMQFFVSFMKKNLVISFQNTDEFYVLNSSEYLITKSLTMEINLIISPPSTYYNTQLGNIIALANSITSKQNAFTSTFISLLRDSYLLLIISPFMQLNLILISLNTILPSNFYHFLRTFIHLTMIGDISMQEENSQVESIDFLFVSNSINLKDYQTFVDTKFCSLNFVNSAIVTIGTFILVIIFLELAYYLFHKIYYRNGISFTQTILNIQGTNQEKSRRVVYYLLYISNNLSSMLFEAAFFIISCAIIINIKSQYLLHVSQVIGYIFSIAIIWGFSIYLTNLFSIFTNAQHYKEIIIDRLYLNYIIPNTTIEEPYKKNSSEVIDLNFSSPQITFIVEEDKLIIQENDDEDSRSFRDKLKSFRQYYHFINLIRKSLIAMFILFFSQVFLAQIIPLCIMQVVLIGYTIFFLPYKNIYLNLIKITAEVSLLIVIILIFLSRKQEQSMQQDHSKDSIPDAKIESFLRLGDTLIAFMSIYMLLHLIISSYKFVHYFINTDQLKTNYNEKFTGESKVIQQQELVMVENMRNISSSISKQMITIDGKNNQKQSSEIYCELEPRYSNNYVYQKFQKQRKND